jgi:peptidyl-tRNA hydrolase
MLNIYIRQDLKMRKGKMAAQSAHAAMKLLFEVMQTENDKMVLQSVQKEEFEAFLSDPEIKIHMVKDEEALHHALQSQLPSATIIDSGRTEFHGVPTLTCAAQGVFSVCEKKEMFVPNAYGKEIKAKQVFVFNKDYPLSKEAACQLSVLTCLKQMYQKMNVDKDQAYFDLSEESVFVNWITSAFAKIGLSAKSLEELNSIEQELKVNKIDYIKKDLDNNYCLCIEPCIPEKIDIITGRLSLI